MSKKKKYKDPHEDDRRKIDLGIIIAPDLQDTPNTATYLAWKTAWGNLEREIDLFWRRGLYFWTFIAAIFVARAASDGAFNVVSIVDSHANVNIGKDQDHSHFIQPMLSALGFLVSFCWVLAGMGSKFWQRNWEIKVSALELKITGPLLGDDQSTKWMTDEKNPMGPFETRFSVSKLAIFVSIVTTIFWFGIFFYDIRAALSKFGQLIAFAETPWVEASIFSVTAFLAILIIIMTRSENKE